MREIDKGLVKSRFARSFRQNNYAGIIQPAMAKYLLELLLENVPERSYQKVLELGCGLSTMAPEMLKHVAVDTWTANDLVPLADEFNETVLDLPLENRRFIAGDMETVDLPDEQNLIISNAAFQWTKSTEALISRLIEKLAPAGVLAFSSFGPENLCELREITGLSLNYLSSSTYPPIFDHDGDLLCLEELKSVIPFESPLAVLRHLKETGTNSLSRQAWTRGDVSHFSAVYRARFGNDDDMVNLTYHPVYVVFQKYARKGE